MAIKTILRMGDARLTQRSRPVGSIGSDDLRNLIEDMFDTMQAQNGVGLAAPQIGVDLRVIIFGVQKSARYPDAEEVPKTVLVNPVIMVMDDTIDEAWEGCLSLPGLRGSIPRFRNIRYHGYDEQGTFIDRVVSGFHARVVQHECDHLDGILYPMRIRDMSRFGYADVHGEQPPLNDEARHARCPRATLAPIPLRQDQDKLTCGQTGIRQ